MLLVKAEAARVDTPHPPPQRPVASPLPPATEAPSSASTPPAKPRSANKTSTADRRSTKRQRKQDVPEELVQQLLAVGFPRSHCVRALRAANNDCQRAAQMLFRKRDTTPRRRKRARSTPKASNGQDTLAAAPTTPARRPSRVDHARVPSPPTPVPTPKRPTPASKCESQTKKKKKKRKHKRRDSASGPTKAKAVQRDSGVVPFEPPSSPRHSPVEDTKGEDVADQFGLEVMKLCGSDGDVGLTGLKRVASTLATLSRGNGFRQVGACTSTLCPAIVPRASWSPCVCLSECFLRFRSAA